MNKGLFKFNYNCLVQRLVSDIQMDIGPINLDKMLLKILITDLKK